MSFDFFDEAEQSDEIMNEINMIPLIDVPGCSNFAPLLLCDSMLASICSGVMDTAGRAGG